MYVLKLKYIFVCVCKRNVKGSRKKWVDISKSAEKIFVLKESIYTHSKIQKNVINNFLQLI